MTDIETIKKNLETQDNRATAEPLYVVFQKDRIWSDSTEWENYVWMDSECDYEAENAEELRNFFLGNCIDPDDARKVKEMTDEEIESYAEEHGFEKRYWREIDRFVTACFTEQGAKDYIALDGHNLTKPFIYVTGLQRNNEMILIRNFLM